MQSIKAIINHVATAQNNTSVATIPRHLPEKQHSTSSTNDHLLSQCIIVVYHAHNEIDTSSSSHDIPGTQNQQQVNVIYQNRSRAEAPDNHIETIPSQTSMIDSSLNDKTQMSDTAHNSKRN